MGTLSLREIVGQGYDDFWHCKLPYRIVKGSKGSKKSKTTALWYIYHLMVYKDANLLVVRKYYSDLKDSCFADLIWAIHKLGVEDYWNWSSGASLHITYKPTGQRIIFRGLDKAEKLASITVSKGVLCWVWIEEFFQIDNEDEFEKLNMSIRGEMPPGLFTQITGTFNPWSEHSWIKARFFDVPRPNVFTKTTTYLINEHLSDVDIQKYKDIEERSPRAARVYCYGEWGVSEGLVYEDWETREFNPREIMQDPDVVPAFGLDFGFKVSYNAFVFLLVNLKTRVMWVCEEMYDKGMTNLDIAKKIIQMGFGKEKIIADAAEPKSIAELRSGFTEIMEDGTVYRYALPRIRPAWKGPDSVENGIQRMQMYHQIVHPRCKNYIIELSSYCYDSDKFGKLMNKPVKEFDHLMDAARYALSQFYSHSRGRISSTSTDSKMEDDGVIDASIQYEREESTKKKTCRVYG